MDERVWVVAGVAGVRFKAGAGETVEEGEAEGSSEGVCWSSRS